MVRVRDFKLHVFISSVQILTLVYSLREIVLPSDSPEKQNQQKVRWIDRQTDGQRGVYFKVLVQMVDHLQHGLQTGNPGKSYRCIQALWQNFF